MINKFKRKDILDFVPYQIGTETYDVCLDANESFIEYDEKIKKEITDKINSLSFNRYPDNSYRSLRVAYGKYVDVNPDNIICTNGSDEAIHLITTAFLNTEDTVLCINPDFSMYRIYTALRGAEYQAIESNEDFSLDADTIIAKVNELKPNIFMFSNPTNPTGFIFPETEIIKIVENCDCIVVVDEAYIDFAEEKGVLEFIDKYENLIVLRTCSKAFGLANIRMGFLLANDKIIYETDKVRVPYNLNGVTSAIAEVIFSHKDVVNKNIETLKDNRDELFEEVKKIDGVEVVETSANFFLFKTDNSDGVYQKLLNRSIKLRQFKSERLKDYLRVCTGSKEENAIFINALKEIMKEEEDGKQ